MEVKLKGLIQNLFIIVHGHGIDILDHVIDGDVELLLWICVDLYVLVGYSYWCSV